MDNENDNVVSSLILQMSKDDPQFKWIIKIGRLMGLEVVCPVTGAETTDLCEVMFPLNYSPLCHDGMQPCIQKLEDVIRLILLKAFGFSGEAATEFLKNVVYVN